MMKIMLVEDDSMLGAAVKSFLEQERFDVEWFLGFDDAQDALLSTAYDLVVLDIQIIGGSGLDLLSHMRAQRDLTPVILLTARDAITQRIEGLDAGADDYVTKPFDLNELCARIHALIRRSKYRSSQVIEYKDLVIDPAAHEVKCGGQTVELSPYEFKIVVKLFDSIGKTVSKAELEDFLAQDGSNVESNAVEVHVHHIRKKLGAQVIKTVRGFGYKIES